MSPAVNVIPEATPTEHTDGNTPKRADLPRTVHSDTNRTTAAVTCGTHMPGFPNKTAPALNLPSFSNCRPAEGRSDATRNSRQGMSSVVENLPVRETSPVRLNGPFIPKQEFREHRVLSVQPLRDREKIENSAEKRRQSRARKLLMNCWTDCRMPAVPWFLRVSHYSFTSLLSLRLLRKNPLSEPIDSAGGHHFRLLGSVFLRWESSDTLRGTGTMYTAPYPEEFSVGIGSLRKNFKPSAGALTGQSCFLPRRCARPRQSGHLRAFPEKSGSCCVRTEIGTGLHTLECPRAIDSTIQLAG